MKLLVAFFGIVTVVTALIWIIARYQVRVKWEEDGEEK